MQNVGSGPQGSSTDSLAPVPHLRNKEQPALFPVTQHPTLPVVAHTELLLTGEPPPQHTLSQREVEASLAAPHMRKATISSTAAPPSKRGRPSLWWFPATRQFWSRPPVADLHDGREGGLAHDG